MDSKDKAKTPMPPTTHIERLLLPLTFWLDIIAYLDKRIEIARNTSGHGTFTLTIKMYDGRVSEVNFGEQLRVRGIIEKIDGPAGHPDPDHGNGIKKELRDAAKDEPPTV